MNKYYMPFFMALCFMLFGNHVIAQNVNDEQLKRVTDNMVTAYQKAIGPQSRLYRGDAYEFYDVFAIGNPYYRDSLAFKNGTVKYDGIIYKNIPLLYDLYRQVLVTYLYDNYSKVALISDIVTEFDLRGHHFINFIPDERNQKMDNGFYDELYNNKLQVLVKRIKTRQEESLTAKKIFYEKTTYYLKKDGIYYTVNNKGQLLDVLSDKKKELKKYIKEKHIDYPDDRDRALLMLVTYYNEISK